MLLKGMLGINSGLTVHLCDWQMEHEGVRKKS
jgi:hypothetical protein